MGPYLPRPGHPQGHVVATGRYEEGWLKICRFTSPRILFIHLEVVILRAKIILNFTFPVLQGKLIVLA